MNKRGHVLNGVLLAVGLGLIVRPSIGAGTLMTIAELFVPVMVGALIPDVDTAFGRHRKTLHNLPVLAVMLVYPVYFGNLQWVWVGVLTHYVLDLLGTRRGIALLYPLWDREFGLPFGVSVSSRWATPVTLAVTALELTFAAAALYWLPPEVLESGFTLIAPQ